MCGPTAGNGSADRNDDSQSAMSCPFHLMTSRTWRMPFSLQFWSSMQSNTVSEGRGDGKRCRRGFPRTRERMVVLGSGMIFHSRDGTSDENENSPTPIIPPPWCEMARHLLPTGTGASATQPLWRLLGNPSSPPGHRSASCISNNSAYMHLLAHGLVFLFDTLVVAFFRFPLRLDDWDVETPLDSVCASWLDT